MIVSLLYLAQIKPSNDTIEVDIIKLIPMSCQTFTLNKARKAELFTHAKSHSYIHSGQLKELQTVFNVTYTDYCGLSAKKRVRHNSQGEKFSLNTKKRAQQFWKIRKKPQLTMERGDSFRVQCVKLHEASPRAKQERMNTEYSQSRIYKTNKGKNAQDLYRFYELQFLEKKMQAMQAEGHKLKFAKFANMKQNQSKGFFRPTTAYLKRSHQINAQDVRKIKTVDLKNVKKRDSYFAINGWDTEIPENEM